MPDAPRSNPLILNLTARVSRLLPAWAKKSIYRVKPLARLVRGGLNRAAPTGLYPVAIAAGELQGMQLSLDLQTEKDYWLGTYEPELQAALRQLLQPGMVTYDVGANIGYITLILARLVGMDGQVFAFEALPENVDRLQVNLRLNGIQGEPLTPPLSQGERETKDVILSESNNVILSRAKDLPPSQEEREKALTPSLSQGERVIKALPLSQVERGLRVTIIPAAVVDKTGPVSFLVGPSGGMGKAQGSAGRQEIAYRGTINVSGISLDEFVYQQGHPPPQLVKMDIEGGEALALPGMRRILQQYHPIVLLELHGPGAAQVAWAELQAAGYRLCRMQPGFPSVPSLEALDWKAYLAAF